MWPLVQPSPAARDARDRFVIAPHHPDRLRRPGGARGTAADERFHQALAWNIFRTLELVSPSFWLRRLHVRLTGEASAVPPQIARVHMWRPLPLPPIQRIDGAAPDVIADVVIETEHAVWTLVAESGRHDLADSEYIAAVVDATAWFAGAREHYCGVIEGASRGTSLGAVLQRRYGRSRESTRLRSATRGPTAPAHTRWGTIQWSTLTALLQECCTAESLLPIERALARHAVEWVKDVEGGSLGRTGRVEQLAAQGRQCEL